MKEDCCEYYIVCVCGLVSFLFSLAEITLLYTSTTRDVSNTFWYFRNLLRCHSGHGNLSTSLFFLEFLGIQSIFLRCGYRFLHVDVSVGNRRAEVLPNTYIFGRQDRLAHATDHVRPREKKKKNKSDLKRRQSLLSVGGCVCVCVCGYE